MRTSLLRSTSRISVTSGDKLTEHTLEPWQYGEEHEGMVSLVDAKGNCIAQVKKGWIVPFQGAVGNARRILACVHACAGIPTEFLEQFTAWQASRKI